MSEGRETCKRCGGSGYFYELRGLDNVGRQKCPCTETQPRVGRRPEPTDGPDYHADLAAWESRRRPFASAELEHEKQVSDQLAADLAMPRGPAPLTNSDKHLIDAWKDQRGLAPMTVVHRLIAIIESRQA